MDPPQNRLAISHILLWTTTTAAMLGAERLAFHPHLGATLNDGIGFFFLGNLLLMAPISGLALAGLVIFSWRWLRGSHALPSQPGHWLLIYFGIQQPLALGGELLLFSWATTIQRILLVWSLLSCVLMGVALLILLIAVRRHASHGWWIASLALIAMYQGLTACFYAGAAYSPHLLASGMFLLPIYLLSAASVVLATILDWRAGREHDFCTAAAWPSPLPYR